MEPNQSLEDAAAKQGIRSDETSDGVRTIVLDHWRAFVAMMTGKGMLAAGFIWRGQSHDWKLQPKLDRDLVPTPPKPTTDDWEGPGPTPEQQWNARYMGQLRKFRAAAAGRRGLNPRNLDGTKGTDQAWDEWWALGQHYGLKTPFLDWTDSPFAALFFAFSKEFPREETGDHSRYVYGLHKDGILGHNYMERTMRDIDIEVKPEPLPAHNPDIASEVSKAQKAREDRIKERLAFPKIRIIQPTTDENLRMLSQVGVFTQSPPGTDIEGFIREHLREYIKGGVVVIKIVVRAEGQDDRKECLISLNRMGINPRSLFPDLHGASDFVNMSLEMPEY